MVRGGGWERHDPLMEKVTETFLGQLVGPSGQSYAISVDFTSIDPETAARVANTIAELYVEHQLGAKQAATTGAVDWLAHRLDELREQLVQSEQAAEEYRVEHELAVSGDGLQFSDEEVAALAQELISTQAERVATQAKLDSIRQVRSSGQSLASVPEVMMSPMIADLRLRKWASCAQAQLRREYGPRHPTILQLQADRVSSLPGWARKREHHRWPCEPGSDHPGPRADAASGSGACQIDLDGQEPSRDPVAATRRRGGIDAHAVHDAARPVQGAHRAARAAGAGGAGDFRGGGPGEAQCSPGEADRGRGIHRLLDVRRAARLRHRPPRSGAAHRPASGGGAQSSAHRPRSQARRYLRGQGAHVYLAEKPTSAYAEAIRSVQTALCFSNVDQPPQVVLVTSSVPAEGKTTLALNLATLLAQSGYRTVAVDLDLRRRISDGLRGRLEVAISSTT